MKKTGCVLMGMFVVLTSFGLAFAEDDVSFDLTADFMSKYIWRGQNLDDDFAFQPGISAAYKNLTVGIWGNQELTSYNDNSCQFTEVDYYADYTTAIAEGVNLSVGMIYYDFPGTALPDTTEVYWGFGFDVPLSPTITVYHDVDEADGIYANFGVSHSIEKIAELGPDMPIGLELGASIGWGDSDYNKYYWGISGDEMQDLALSAAFPITLGSWTLTPSVHYVTLVSSDIKKTDAYDTSSDYFFAGIGLSTSF